MITYWYIGYLIAQYGANNITVDDVKYLTQMLAGNDAYDEVNKISKPERFVQSND